MTNPMVEYIWTAEYIVASATAAHIDVDPRVVVEDGDLGVVRGDESVELLLVVVPLDRVQVVALQVVVAPQHRLLAAQRVRRDHRVLQQTHPSRH